MDSDRKHSDLTDLIIKSFYKVYNTLGYGFRERVYRRSMRIELMKLGLKVIEEAPIKVYYEGIAVGRYSADLLVENKVIVELKSKRVLIEDFEAQLVHYLKATVYEVGLLLNFGPEPQIKRKVFDNARKGSLAWIKEGKDDSLQQQK